MIRVLCTKRFGPPQDQILDRLKLVEATWFSIYIHCMQKGDPPGGRHGHPRSFITLLLAGSYGEMIWDDPHGVHRVRRHDRRLRPMLIRQRQIHRIDSIDAPCWTLVLAGPMKPGSREGGAGC